MTASAVSRLRPADVDIAIRLGDGDYPGLHVAKLMTEQLFPVCSPRMPVSRV